jgi:hypothetical protein
MDDLKKLLADVKFLEQEVKNKTNALKNASRWTVQLSEKQKQDPAQAGYVAKKRAEQEQARKDLEKVKDDLETANTAATNAAQQQAINPSAADKQRLIDEANRRGEIYEPPTAELIDTSKPITAQDDYAGFTLDKTGKVFGPSGVEGENGNQGIFVPTKGADGKLGNQFVTSSNKAIDLFLKDYQGVGQLDGLKKRLVASGYIKQSELGGTAWLSGLVDMLAAYSGDYLQKIKFEGATDLPDINVFMSKKKVGSGTGTTPYRVITTRGDAKKLLNEYLNNLIGEPATPEEETAFYDELNKAESKAVRYTSAGMTTGSVLTEADRLTIAAKVARKRLRGTNVDELLKSNIGSTVALDISSMQKYAARYGIQMTAAEALKRVADGIGQENYAAKQQERLKLVAKQLHPNLAAHIDAGGTVEDIADQYAYAKARKLGIAIPVSTTDADVMNAVNSGMSVSDFNMAMQKKPEWRKTDEARDMASDFTSTMLKTFGLG